MTTALSALPDYGPVLRPLWAFDEGITFLNQGAFGATLRELLEVQSRWRARMERQTARFFMSELPGLIRESATAIAAFSGAAPERTVMLENASSGIMAVLGSLPFAPGDRIVTTDHVYGAVRHALTHVARRSGASVVEVPVPLPVAGPQDFLAALEQAIDADTRLVVIDHVASPTSLVLPVQQIAALCRRRGARLLIDAAHAPGMLDLDIDAVGADFYVANCHKWLCAPKGAAFMVIGTDAAETVDLHPLVISHAYGQGPVAEFGKIGTRDPSAWLTVPEAIAAHDRLGGSVMRARNTGLARDGGRMLAARMGTVLSGPEAMFGSMVSVQLPAEMGPATPARAADLREALWQSDRIEALILPHSGALWLRLCAFAYNEIVEFERVGNAVEALRRTGSGA